MAVVLTRGRVMWKVAFLAVIWVICKERNRRCFGISLSTVETLVESQVLFSHMGVYPPPL